MESCWRFEYEGTVDASHPRTHPSSGLLLASTGSYGAPLSSREMLVMSSLGRMLVSSNQGWTAAVKGPHHRVLT